MKKILKMRIVLEIILVFVLTIGFGSVNINALANATFHYRFDLFNAPKTPNIFTNGDYIWIWDEYANAPGNIYTADVVFWGPNYGPYHNYDELTYKIHSLENHFPNFVDVFSIGQSTYKRNIWAIKITNESSTNAKYEFYLVAEHHAREAITLENALYFMDKLIYSALFEHNKTIIQLLNNAEIYIIPLLNPDGHSILWWYPYQRKNLRIQDDDGDGTLEDEYEVRVIWDPNVNHSVEVYEDSSDPDTQVGEDTPGGVDLNRNYDFEWYGPGSSVTKNQEDYRGPYPASEPETQAIMSFMYQHDFRYALSLHSGIQAVIKPWGYTSGSPPHNEELTATEEKLMNITSFPSWEQIGGYSVNGEWGDWCLAKRDILSYTIEVYGGATYESIWDFFNPPANQVINNSALIYNAAAFLATDPHFSEINNLPDVENVIVNRINSTHISVSWAASDPDADELSYSVYLGHHNNWTLAATDLNDTNVIIDLQSLFLRDGNYKVKVVANDDIDRVVNYSRETISIEFPTTGKLSLKTINNQTMVLITLDDDDLNHNGSKIETVIVKAKSSIDAMGINVTLTETEPDSGIFSGNVSLSLEQSPDSLQVAENDTVTVLYYDENTENGPTTISQTISVEYGQSIVTTSSSISTTSTTTSTSTKETTTTTVTSTSTKHSGMSVLALLGILAVTPLVTKKLVNRSKRN